MTSFYSLWLSLFLEVAARKAGKLLPAALHTDGPAGGGGQEVTAVRGGGTREQEQHVKWSKVEKMILSIQDV